MALIIENTIDLTAYADNPAPKVVSQLSIIHESSDGELVQYYIKPGNQTQGDKNTYAIGVFDKDSRTYSYHDYPELVWGEPGQRICGNRIERLGERTFSIVLTQGLNRQIRRMVRACGGEVKRLKRTRVLNVELGAMKPGQQRILTKEETESLYQAAGLKAPD